MNKKQVVSIIIALLIELPIWLYLIYWILSQLNPDRLVWFLFIIYIPAIITTSILGKIMMGEKE